MTEILLYGTLGALAGILASCIASGIYAAWHNWRVRRRNRIEMARRLRQPGWAFLPPALPTKPTFPPNRKGNAQ